MVQSQCLTRYLKKRRWESQLKGKTHNESLDKQGPGAQGAQGSASAEHWFTARETQPRELGAAWKRLRVSAHGHLKSAFTWKTASEAKLRCCYRPQVMFWEWILRWPTSSAVSPTDTGVRKYLGLEQDPDWADRWDVPCNSSPNLSSCSNPSPGRGHTWNFGHMNLAKFPETGWTSHLQQTSGVSCCCGYLNLGVSGRASRCFVIRQLLTSFQQIFSSTAHVIFPTFFSTKRSSSLPGKIFSFPTKHYPKISLWIKSKLLILLSVPRSRTSLFS